MLLLNLAISYTTSTRVLYDNFKQTYPYLFDLRHNPKRHRELNMERWPPRAFSYEGSGLRKHPTHCESKGPIVHEGFVAQRIKALQVLQAQYQAGKHSHSPIDSCPPRSNYTRSPQST